MRRLCSLMAAVGMVALLGCPSPPDNADHRGATNPDCIECHFHGEGRRPPGDHWEGDTAAEAHDACTHCHAVE